MTFQLELELPNGSKQSFKHKKIKKTLKINKLKQLLSLEYEDENVGIPEDSELIDIQYNNESLKNNKTLSDYNLNENSLIKILILENSSVSQSDLIIMTTEQTQLITKINDRVSHYENILQFLDDNKKNKNKNLRKIVGKINKIGIMLIDLIHEKLKELIIKSKNNLNKQSSENNKHKNVCINVLKTIKEHQINIYNLLESQKYNNLIDINSKNIHINNINTEFKKIIKQVLLYKKINDISMKNNRLYFGDNIIENIINNNFSVNMNNNDNNDVIKCINNDEDSFTIKVDNMVKDAVENIDDNTVVNKDVSNVANDIISTDDLLKDVDITAIKNEGSFDELID